MITPSSQTSMLAGDSDSNLLWIITPPELLSSWDVSSSNWGIDEYLTNTLCYVVVSMTTRPSLSELPQSAAFVGTPLPENENISLLSNRVTVAEQMLASRFVGRKRAEVLWLQLLKKSNIGRHCFPISKRPQADSTRRARARRGVRCFVCWLVVPLR
ncbi:hypothetical protein O9992_07995 [Vibrio lentus]|nr:hypothetical protein [Vibrio lentus]